MMYTLDDLLALPAAGRAALLANLPDAELIALADIRALRPVRSRRHALLLIEAEAELYAALRDAGKH